LATYRNVSEILKAAKEFAKEASFNHEKTRTFLAPRGNFGASQLTEFHATKVYSYPLYAEFIYHICYLQFRAKQDI
jgi:hypothetical protein